MTVFVYIGLALAGLLFYLPVYLPFGLSFFCCAPKWSALKWACRIASGGNLLLAIVPPPGLRHDFGDDVAGNMAGAAHNFPIVLAWVWGGGWTVNFLAVGIGLAIGWRRGRACSTRSKPGLEQTSDGIYAPKTAVESDRLT
jgi:hypothetical protein